MCGCVGPKTKPPDELRGGTVMELLQHYRYRVGDLHRSPPHFTSPSLPHPPTLKRRSRGAWRVGDKKMIMLLCQCSGDSYLDSLGPGEFQSSGNRE